MNTIKVAILASRKLFADTLTVSPNGQVGIEVVNTFNDGASALAYFEKESVDVLLVDDDLPGTLGIDLVMTLKLRHLKIKCVVLLDNDDEGTIFSALNAGASGYIQRNAEIATVISAIRDVYNGGFPMSSGVARKIIDKLFTAGQPNLLSDYISPRENEILQLLSLGYRYKEIAGLLFISVETVRTHIRNMYEKLHVNSRAEAIRKVKDNMKGHVRK